MSMNVSNASLRFLGAAGTVTGSKHLLDVGDRRILVDCGLFQGPKELRLRNWEPLPIDPGSIDAVVPTLPGGRHARRVSAAGGRREGNQTSGSRVSSRRAPRAHRGWSVQIAAHHERVALNLR